MKKIPFILLMLVSQLIYSQSILGKWISVDDKTGKEKAVIEIYEVDNKFEGKIVKFLEKGVSDDDPCEHCKGDMKGKKLIGFKILKDFEANGDKFENGTVTDPEEDKTYESKIWVDEDDKNTLHVRGYVSVFYRTQQWKRYQEN